MVAAAQPLIIYNTRTVSASENIPLFLTCFERVHLIVHCTAVTSSPTLDVAFEYKAQREGSDWVAVAGGGITQMTSASVGGTELVTLENSSLVSEDMRLVITFGGSGDITVDIALTVVV